MRFFILILFFVAGNLVYAQQADIRGKNWVLVSIQDSSLNKVYEFDKQHALLYFSDTSFVISGKELHYGQSRFAKDTNLVRIRSHEQNEWTSRSKDSYFAKYFWDLTYTLNVNLLEMRNGNGVTFRFLAGR